MADTKVELALNGDAAIELDVLKSALGQDVINTRSLDSEGMFIFDPGFTPAASCEPRITFIDGDEGILLYRDFSIGQLTTKPNYLEVCYILLYGEKPTQEEYDKFRATVTRHTMVHKQITCLFHGFRRDSHPMAVICGVTGAPAAFYRDLLNVGNARHREIAAFCLLSKVLTMTTMCYKYSIRQPFVYPRNDLSYTGNFLNMIFSTPCEKYEVNPVLERAMNHILILRANYGQNASTSTVRTTGSSGANPFACIVTSIASLWGPAHGGTNEAALKMLKEISSVEHIPGFVRRAKDKNDSFRLMGLGHRVYKSYDPRTTVVRETCHEVLKELGTRDDLLEVVVELEHITLNDPYFIGKKLCPNIDFCSGITLKAMGIPSSMFTVIFTMTRTVGRIAHWDEMYTDGMKIARPRQLYTGCGKCDLKPDIKR